MAKTHNKKRNTAFLYEVLILELTKAVLNNDSSQREVITDLLKTHFSRGSILSKELDCYKALYETTVDPYTLEKIIIEAKRAYHGLDTAAIFKAQSSLISDVNHKVSMEVYGNFVPNYKHIATISRILNPTTPIADRVLYEKKILDKSVAETPSEKEVLQPVGNLIYKTFVKKFNEVYEDKLLPEQKILIKNYIEAEDQVALKVSLSNEMTRLGTEMNRLMKLPIVKENMEIKNDLEKAVETLETEFPKRQIDNTFIVDIMKLQQIVSDVVRIAKEE